MQDLRGMFIFDGVVDGVSLKAMIVPLSGNRSRNNPQNGTKFQISIKGTSANMAGIALPLKFEFAVGDDGGSGVLSQAIFE